MPEETPVINTTLFSIMSFHSSRKHQPSLSQPTSLCRLTEAASDTQCFARDPPGIRRSEKDRGGSDVLGLADAAKRSLRFNAFAKIALVEARCAHSLRFHHAGIDGVNADFARPQFLGQRPGDGVDRAFCAGVNRRTWRCQRRDGRANIDNVAASGIELPDRFLRGEKQAENIYVKMFVELLFGDLFKWRPIVNSSVVDEDVDLAEGFFSLSKEMFDVYLPGYICPHSNGLSATLCNLIYYSV